MFRQYSLLERINVRIVGFYLGLISNPLEEMELEFSANIPSWRESTSEFLPRFDL